MRIRLHRAPLALLLFLGALAGGVATAQQGAAPREQPRLDPQLAGRTPIGLINESVRDAAGRPFGHIEDVVRDRETGELAFVVARERSASLPEHYLLLPVTALAARPDGLQLTRPLGPDEIRRLNDRYLSQRQTHYPVDTDDTLGELLLQVPVASAPDTGRP